MRRSILVLAIIPIILASVAFSSRYVIALIVFIGLTGFGGSP
jgi:hypothetical protein